MCVCVHTCVCECVCVFVCARAQIPYLPQLHGADKEAIIVFPGRPDLIDGAWNEILHASSAGFAARAAGRVESTSIATSARRRTEATTVLIKHSFFS